jgi:23S rRNA (cytidine1920-2'-O)/16S rRNA (cytidine1409-2'-O)-methyltransferase
MSMNSFHARQKKPRPPGHASPAGRRPGGPLRADALLVLRGLAPSRTAARRMIAAGLARADGVAITKPAQELPESSDIELLADADARYVSRGGLKLAGALARTRLDVRGMRCLDVGQSTGGFTDCLLQAGAARVVGVEVGHGQLHAQLRGDPRVTCIEGLNARALAAADLGDAMPSAGFELIVCGASFISLTLLLPRWPALLAAGGHVIALVKPQVEVGPQLVAKGGIVRDEARYSEVEATIRGAAAEAGLAVLDYFDSPITGGDGKREFFLFATPTHACEQTEHST